MTIHLPGGERPMQGCERELLVEENLFQTHGG